MADQSLSVELRRVETQVSDGPGQDRTEHSYVIGGVVDGTFVPFFTKAGTHVDTLAAQLADRDQATGAGDQATADAPSTADAPHDPTQPNQA
jgi:hypothetical protein